MIDDRCMRKLLCCDTRQDELDKERPILVKEQIVAVLLNLDRHEAIDIGRQADHVPMQARTLEIDEGSCEIGRALDDGAYGSKEPRLQRPIERDRRRDRKQNGGNRRNDREETNNVGVKARPRLARTPSAKDISRFNRHDDRKRDDQTGVDAQYRHDDISRRRDRRDRTDDQEAHQRRQQRQDDEERAKKADPLLITSVLPGHAVFQRSKLASVRLIEGPRPVSHGAFETLLFNCDINQASVPQMLLLCIARNDAAPLYATKSALKLPLHCPQIFGEKFHRSRASCPSAHRENREALNDGRSRQWWCSAERHEASCR